MTPICYWRINFALHPSGHSETSGLSDGNEGGGGGAGGGGGGRHEGRSTKRHQRRSVRSRSRHEKLSKAKLNVLNVRAEPEFTNRVSLTHFHSRALV